MLGLYIILTIVAVLTVLNTFRINRVEQYIKAFNKEITKGVKYVE